MSVVVLRGDAAHLPLPDGSVDADVCDPPYAINFMGRSWDDFGRQVEYAEREGYGDKGILPGYGRGGRNADVAKYRIRAATTFQEWCEAWASECLRVLKPGGWLLAFGGTRTWHRLVCGIEDAGFEVRDAVADLTGYDAPGLMWTYGSGFPKSLDVSKAIDKRPKVMQMREFAEHLAARREVCGLSRQDVSERVVGTRSGACWNWEAGIRYPEFRWWPALRDLLGLDGKWEAVVAEAEREIVAERQGLTSTFDVGATTPVGKRLPITAPATEDAARWEGWGTALKPGWEPIAVARKPLAGTVAQNVLEYGTGALNLAACTVAHASEADRAESEGKNRHADFDSGPRDHNGVYQGQPAADRAQYDGSAGRWPPNVVLGPAAAAELDRQSGVTASRIGKPRKSATPGDGYGMTHTGAEYEDAGGASRFFPVFRYEAKAGAAERTRLPDGSKWPTVKPVPLMQWLVRLVTPPGGKVLDLFAGTGPTGEACAIEGFDCILLDRDPQAIAHSRIRLAKMIQPGLFRLEDSAPAAPVRRVAASRPKPVPEVHASLFDDLESAS